MKLAVFGYGNLGRGVECAIQQNSDMELVGVFTRRDPKTISTLTDVPVLSAEFIASYKDNIDVLVVCGGSATDLPIIMPKLAEQFCVVDSFDTHACIPNHFSKVDEAARRNGKTALISGGWDPGLFSLNRLYADTILPIGKSYTFWGPGISQGHSDAIRRIPGVIDARQYTNPVPIALDSVRKGELPELSVRQKHTRECYVVVEEGADKSAIETAIKTMPNYFSDYVTSVEFITMEELQKNHKEFPHGGVIIRTGLTGMNHEHKNTIEYNLKLDSNPEFTASVLVALSRAVYKMNSRGNVGCKTIFDIAPADLSPLSSEELRTRFL